MQARFPASRMRTLKYSPIVLLLTLTGCTSVYNLSDSEREGIISRTYRDAPSDVHTAYLRYFQTNGWTITVSDKETGVITTDWKDAGFKANLGARTRRRYSAAIVPEGDARTKVSLTLQQETANYNDDNWTQQVMHKKYLTPRLNEVFEVV